MPKCLDHDFPCQDPQYLDFDKIAIEELRDPPSASEIVNASEFCTFVPVDQRMQLGDLSPRDFLRSLQAKVGLYHLWVDHDNCDDHGTHTMLCVYVGKGMAEGRIYSHIKNRWPEQDVNLYVSFYECNNRMAKYLEQLFLDTYAFHLNSNENCGTRQLFGVWDEDRHFLGTEMHSVSSLSKLTGIEDL